MTVGYSDAACLTMWVLWHVPEDDALSTTDIVLMVDDMSAAEREHAIGYVRQVLSDQQATA